MRKWRLGGILFIAAGLLVFTSCVVSPYQQPYPYGQGSQQPYRYGPGGGMMGGQGGMMGGGWGNYNPNAQPLSIDQAADAARRYLSAYRGNLVLTEVMEFTENFYAEVEEEDTGIHAIELLIDKYTGQVYPEYGPNMMWNTRYSMMGTMMGNSYRGQFATNMSVTPEQAESLARKWLDVNQTGLGLAEPDIFYGYYTLHTLKDGQVEGMLSVNGYTGAVWYHNWHGTFITMEEFE